MLYAKVNQAARKALNLAIITAENVKWYRRLKVIDLSARRQNVSEIAAIFDLSDNTVRDYINRYNQDLTHTTPALDQFLQDNRHRFEVVFLPTYSPNLNLIEKLWKIMRAQVTNNQPFADLPTLSQAVVRWFEKLSFTQFCSLMGISDTASSNL